MHPITRITFALSACSLLAIASEPPEKTLGTVLRQNAGKAVHVDGVIIAAKTLGVKGVVHGTESDLTVTAGGIPGRTIILKGKSWTSVDDKTWEPAEEVDRSFPKMVMGPLIYNGQPTPPFEEVDRKEQNDGTVLQHIRLKVPKDDDSSDRPHYWIAWSEGKPVEIRRAEMPGLIGGHVVTIKADYRLVTELPAVKSPDALKAKTAGTAQQSSPEVLLAAAKRNMTKHPAWKFTATVEARKKMKLSGILEGQNCDLTLDDDFRQVLFGKTQYASTDGGKTWEKAEVERDLFHLVNTPVRSRPDEKIPPFEIVKTDEKADGITIMHIRYKAPEVVQEEGDRPNYWIVLINGKSSAVLRYHGPMAFQGQYVTGKVDYELADVDAEGTPLVTIPKSAKP